MRASSARFGLAVLWAAVLASQGGVGATANEVLEPTTLRYPGSSATPAREINNDADIAGLFSCAAGGCTHPLIAPESRRFNETTVGVTRRGPRLPLLAALGPLAAARAALAPVLVERAEPNATEVLHVPRDFTTIQAAVNAAPQGAIIQVAAGIYHENVVITTPHLRLHGSQGVVLDGNGAGGFGILAVGTAQNPLTGIEISGFEIRNFGKGVLLLWVEQGRVHRNEVHHNLMGTPIDGIGIELDSTRFTVVSQNLAHNNGRRGIQINRSSDNLVLGNRAYENGTQQLATFAGAGFMVTGEGGHNNQLRENEALRNHGRGFLLSKTLGTTPVTGNVVAQNRAHENQRSGIAIMNLASGNFVLQNDARWNNLSGLPPCYDCNLVELFTPAPNVWQRNLGTFNLEDNCRP